MAQRKKRGRLPEEDKRDGVIDINEARRIRQEKRQAELRKRANNRKKADAKKASKKPRKITKRTVVSIIVAVIFIVAMIASLVNLFSLRAQRAQAQQKLEELIAEKEMLLRELDTTSSDEVIEREARESLKMIRPGEQFFVFPKDMTNDDKSDEDTTN